MAYAHMHKARKRAADLIRGAGYSMGGHTPPKDDRESDIKLISKGIREHEDQEHGGKHARLHFRDGGSTDGEMAPRRLDHRDHAQHADDEGGVG